MQHLLRTREKLVFYQKIVLKEENVEYNGTSVTKSSFLGIYPKLGFGEDNYVDR